MLFSSCIGTEEKCNKYILDYRNRTLGQYEKSPIETKEELINCLFSEFGKDTSQSLFYINYFFYEKDMIDHNLRVSTQRLPKVSDRFVTFYIISSLYFSDFSRTILLLDENNKVISNTDTLNILDLKYADWIEDLNNHGLEELIRMKKNPLLGTSYKWVRSAE